MDWRKVILPALRDVLLRHVTTGAGAGAVFGGDNLETQAAGLAAVLVSVGFAVAGELKMRRRIKKAGDTSPSPTGKGR